MMLLSSFSTSHIFLFISLALLLQQLQPLDAIQLRDLRVCDLTNPLGVTNPVFSWLLYDPLFTTRGLNQTAYQIIVTDQDGIIYWDSGPVKSSFNFLVPYEGKTLNSSTLYFWKVRVWDTNGILSPFSPTASFVTGILNDDEWIAQWITGGDYVNQLRTEFTLPSGTLSASVVHVSGLGYFELRCNGQKVGDPKRLHDVGWTDYAKRSYYVTFDLSPYLLPGQANTLAVTLGNGWFSCLGSQPGCLKSPPQLFLQASVTYADNPAHPLIVSSQAGNITNQVWKCSPGPVLNDSIYNGETYDANKETPGWDQPGYDDSTWTVAVTAKVVPNILTAQVFEPIRKVSERHPVSVSVTPDGGYVVDFGQNLAGIVRLTIRECPKGTQVVLRHAELLINEPYGVFTGDIYTGNLRGAKATDTYICKGDPSGVEVYEPMFTQHGFRFCKVIGLMQTPVEDDIVSVEMHTDVAETGEIVTNHPLINKIQHNVIWGQKSNLMSVPSDCPQRDERLGWMGDAALTSEEAILNFHMSAFYVHWMDIVRDDQNIDGSTTNVVPSLGSTSPGAPNWQTAYPTVLWTLLRYRGDVEIIENHWDALLKYYEFWQTMYLRTGLKNFMTGFGDWVPPPPQPSANLNLVGAFAFIRDLTLFVEMCEALGKDDLARITSAKIEMLNEEFHNVFFNISVKGYGSGLQTENAMALWLNAVPEEYLQTVLDSLVNDILVTQNVHPTTGIIGWKFMLEALMHHNRSDVGLQLVLQDTYPSFGYMIQGVGNFEPATTIWELWDSNVEGPGMNSRNHIMFGSVGSWFYKALLGLRPSSAQLSTSVPRRAGFSHFTLGPDASVVNRLNTTSVSGHVATPYGTVALSWNINFAKSCLRVVENEEMQLECESEILSIPFVSYGNATGSCASGFHMGKCDASTSRSVVEKACLGRLSCTVSASNDVFGDPCVNTPKTLAVVAHCNSVTLPFYNMLVKVPIGSTATVFVPVVPSLQQTLNNLIIQEGFNETITLWANATFVPGAVKGVVQAHVNERRDTVLLRVLSGSYRFVSTGSK